MINLNPFSIRKPNFNNNTINKVYNAPLRFINHAPLKADTISFTSNEAQSVKKGPKNDAKLAELARALGKVINNDENCREVSENAEYAERHFKTTLTSALRPFVFNEKTNPKGLIDNISTRIKTGESAKEKVMDALVDVITSDKEKFKIYSSESLKSILGDIIGARIVLKRCEQSETSKLINALIQQVKQKKLKITRIENYVYDKNNHDLKYFSDEDLKCLLDAANSMLSPGEPKVELKNTPKPTGYMALHIDVDLSSPDYIQRYNGYKGEIQIVGYDVEQLKEVEDYCYKLKQGKDIKGGHKAYDAFVEYFNKYMDEEKYPNIRADFLEYTKRAYLFQRKKEPIHTSTKRKPKNVPYRLPSISQCGMQDKIPSQLDFNNLALIKKKSDELYETIQTASSDNNIKNK